MYNFKSDAQTEKNVVIESQNIPYKITASGLEQFAIVDQGYEYAVAGINFAFKKESLGTLTGSYFAPMSMFAFMSMMSFNINIDSVCFNLITMCDFHDFGLTFFLHIVFLHF